MSELDTAPDPLGKRRVDVGDLKPERTPFGLTGDGASCRKIVKSPLSCSATVCRSGTSNSTFRPRVSTYQLRERARSVTGILRWSNLSMLVTSVD